MMGAPVLIGLDIGGTKILAACFDASGRMEEPLRVQTPADLDQGLSLLKDLIQRASKGRPITGIGASIGGPLDYLRGIVSPLHQPQWRTVPLKDIMEKSFGCPFSVDVDTNVAALGEYAFGGDRMARLFYLTVSTGVGGSMLIDGEIYRGANGIHPEPGHQSIPFVCNGRKEIRCFCGANGCLESLVSGRAIREIYSKPAEELNGAEWNEVGHNLGQGLRNIAVLFAPEVIVLGGGVVLGGREKILEPAVNILCENLRLVSLPQVRISTLGHEALLRGAFVLARNTLTLLGT